MTGHSAHLASQTNWERFFTLKPLQLMPTEGFIRLKNHGKKNEMNSGGLFIFRPSLKIDRMEGRSLRKM